MSKIQKIVLACSSVFFALTLIAFLQSDMWLLLISFVVHSILLIIFSLLCWRETETPATEIEELNERITQIKAQWQEESDRLRAESAGKDEAISESAQSLSVANAKISDLYTEIDALKDELSRRDIKDQENSANESSILPPFLPERSASQTIGIIDMVKSVAREFSSEAALAGVNINISSSDDSLMVKADPGMMRILFRNIIDNSIKYMMRHGTLVITVSSIDTDIFVVCKDTGNGLAEEETKHIFELNYQGSNRISGNGLGLYQAKAIVNYYGGTIYAKSTPGKGMGIYIQLPTS